MLEVATPPYQDILDLSFGLFWIGLFSVVKAAETLFSTSESALVFGVEVHYASYDVDDSWTFDETVVSPHWSSMLYL